MKSSSPVEELRDINEYLVGWWIWCFWDGNVSYLDHDLRSWDFSILGSILGILVSFTLLRLFIDGHVVFRSMMHACSEILDASVFSVSELCLTRVLLDHLNGTVKCAHYVSKESRCPPRVRHRHYMILEVSVLLTFAWLVVWFFTSQDLFLK